MRTFFLTVVLGLAAVVVYLSTPSEADQLAPFSERAAIGERAQGRTFAVRVEKVALAQEVTDGDWVGTTDGIWVVATLTAEAVAQPGSVTGSLYLGDLRFDASERPSNSALNGSLLGPGLAQVGDLVFEVPLDALDDAAVLRVSSRVDPRLDSAVEVPLELSELEPAPVLALTPVERSAR